MSDFESGSIVIVDDNANNLQVLSSMLQDGGYKARPALSGEIALRAVAAAPPDLILLDIRMPGMDGYETCKRLKSDAVSRDVPVIFISALDESEDKLAAFRAGGVDYVSKPFRTEEVMARVRAHLQIRRMQQRQESLVAELSAGNARLQAEQARNLQLIEENKRTQAQLLESEKMAAIGQLAAGVAHEINNPIGFVNANLGTLANYIDSLLTALERYEADESYLPQDKRDAMAELRARLDIGYVREDIGTLLGESKDGLLRVARIVADLKDFARVDAEHLQFADLEHGLDCAINLAGKELKSKAEVIKDYGHPPAVECIPSQLNRVFLNLLTNAAQAIDGHGTITVRTGRDGEQAWVEVEDTGRGIAPENLGRIFDPFFSTQPIGRGMGLGLSAAYGIVEGHHGHISVRSKEGQGSIFRVTLPQYAGSTAPAQL